VEAETVQQGGDAGLCVLAGFVEDAVRDGGLGDLLFGGLADRGFERGVGGGEETRVAGVDASALVIEARAENLRLRQADGDGLAVDRDVAGAKLAEIYAGDDFAVGDEQEPVTSEEVGEQGDALLSLDDLSME
jgi:hypothetical protein